MKRNVGQKTVHVLRACLERQFKREMDKINSHYRHDFSEEKPEFVLTIKVSAYEFCTSVMEGEIEILQKQLERAKKKLEVLEPKVCSNTLTDKTLNDMVEESKVPITEVGYEFGDDVIAHQKKGVYHRLVYCCTPPQKAGDWVASDATAYVHRYYCLAHDQEVKKNW